MAKATKKAAPKAAPKAAAPKPAADERIISGGFTLQQKKAVDDFMTKNLGSDICVEDIAKVVQFSPAHFNRLFRRTYRTSPHQKLISMRVEKARDMIKKGNLSLSDIAHETGFCDQSHLTHLFRRHFGVTPGKVK
jgi:AraC family transcriptional regulator